MRLLSLKRCFVCWNRAVVITLIVAVLANYPFAPPAAAQVGVLTVVTAGLTLGQILKEIESKAYKIIGRAAEAANLAADAAARNALLAIDAERDALNRDLATQWDNLEHTKQDVVKALDTYVDKIEAALANVERLEELATLDVDGLLSKIPFVSKTYAIKSVTGSQFYREDGHYRFTIRSNALNFSGRGYNLLIDGRPLDPKWVAQPRQYEIELLIPASFLESKFTDRELAMVALEMSIEVADRQSWEVWRPKTRWAYFKALIRLFPRFPVEYRLEEHKSTNAPDRSREEWYQSQVATVGGCGDSNCYGYYNVYAYLPAGTEATGRVKECSDSFSGWGSFVQPNGTVTVFGKQFPIYQPICTHLSDIVNAIEVNGTTVRMLYQQHSHDHTRNVSFKAGYHPLSAQGSVRQIELVALKVGNDGKPQQKEQATVSSFAELKPVPARVSFVLLGGLFSGSASYETSSTRTTVQTVDATIPTVRSGFLQYGQPYQGTFSNDMDAYTLTAKDFAGNPIVVTESKSDPRIEVKDTRLSTLKRIIVTPKLPW